MTLKFWITDKTLIAQDYVKPSSFATTTRWYSSVNEETMGIPLKKLTHYYDVQTKEFKDQEYIEFEMKVTCPKLDEVAIAKNENVESGVEDSEPEEK